MMMWNALEEKFEAAERYESTADIVNREMTLGLPTNLCLDMFNWQI